MAEYTYETSTDEEGEHHTGVRLTRSKKITRTVTARPDGTWVLVRRVQRLNEGYGEITRSVTELEPGHPQDAAVLARQLISEMESAGDRGWVKGGWS